MAAGPGATAAAPYEYLGWGNRQKPTDAMAATGVSGYHLRGTAFDSGDDMVFTAPFAVTALTDPGSQVWLDALWDKLATTSIDPQLYYGGSVRLQSMSVASGDYQVP